MRKTTWVDIDLTFSKKRSGDINDLVGIDAIKSSIKNIIETMRLQRRMLPLFAGKYQNLLFEPMDNVTAGELGEEILGEIEKWEPRIIIKNININTDYDNLKYLATVTFSLRNSYDVHTVEVDIIQRG